MSSEITQSFYVTSISYSFNLKWILKGKDLQNLSQNLVNASVMRSDLYLLKAAKDLGFCLEIKKSRKSYDISIKGSKMWSFELAYAFLVTKEKAHNLKSSLKLSFLRSCQYSDILDEDVAIHCLVIADPVLFSSTEEADLSIAINDLHPEENQNTVDIGDLPKITLPGNYSNKVVIDFIRRGDIPDFDVNMAIQIIREVENHNCMVLKILCVHYLMQNITSQNLRMISRAALDYSLPDLERACVEKIANGYIQTK